MTFFLTLVFVFMVFWRPQDWLVPWLYGWPLLDAVVVLAMFSFVVEMDMGRIRLPRNSPQVYLLGGLWVATIMSHVAHTYFAGMIQTIPETFKICFFTALLICTLDRPSRLRAVAIVFVVMACIMAVHAIMQQRIGYGFVHQGPVYQLNPRTGQIIVRSLFFGIFEDPNDLAQILATSIPLAFAITRRRSFILGCAITYLLYLGIETTHSRGGYIALAGAGAVMLVLVLPARWMPYAIAVLLVGALAACVYAGVWLDESARNRVVYWGMANWAFRSNPIFGLGYGMFWQVMGRETAAHNAFVLCYTELGFFGYWFWFGLLFIGLMGAWRARAALTKPENQEQDWVKRFAGLCVASTMAFSASAYFLSRTFVYPLFFLFAMLAALPVVVRELLPEDHPPLLSVSKDVMIIGTIATIGSIIYIYISIILLNKAFGGG
jgi:hypothetical protein